MPVDLPTAYSPCLPVPFLRPCHDNLLLTKHHYSTILTKLHPYGLGPTLWINLFSPWTLFRYPFLNFNCNSSLNHESFSNTIIIISPSITQQCYAIQPEPEPLEYRNHFGYYASAIDWYLSQSPYHNITCLLHLINEVT